MKWTFIWLSIAAMIALVVGGSNVPLYYRLVANGVRSQATVVELTPQIHLTVRYEYQVGGRKFEGQRAPSPPNPPLDEIRVGQSLVIYYDPLNLSGSVPGDPKPMLINELIFVGMAVLLAPTFIVFVLREREKRSKVV